MTKESPDEVHSCRQFGAWREHVQLPLAAAALENLELATYQRVASDTDRLPTTLEFPILGLFGEVGGLLSLLKKRARDNKSFAQFDANLLEEFGDVVWYLSIIASRCEVALEQIALRISTDPDKTSRHTPEIGTFDELQAEAKSVGDLNSEARNLAGKVGNLVNDIHRCGDTSNGATLFLHLVEILTSTARCANAARVSLSAAARENLYKIFNRWPIKESYPPRIDLNHEPYEKFPSSLKILISEEKVNGRLYVFQRCNDIYIGDRLTDNKQGGDDYRFHDVFHIAFAVHLGWSPVLRALLHLKRKSLPEVDENQDGARAILIEEGIATFIFERGLRAGWDKREVENVDFDLLKYVAEFVRGYEAERCCMWQWERAILDAFSVFRSLKAERKGWIHADLDNHTLQFQSAY